MTARNSTPQGSARTGHIDRRSLLLGLGAAVAAAGVVPLGSDVLSTAARAGQPAAADAANASQQSGYHLTDHVRAYYRSARM
ncbi:hypothetical protein GALL_494740 [mine drainage metagenome]|uniref:Formate dehydrogenase region TAT target n=1 Tax=mine drainage metagenome TaxID=410659 RepID=A0A1J5PB96_9ZZZZ